MRRLPLGALMIALIVLAPPLRAQEAGGPDSGSRAAPLDDGHGHGEFVHESEDAKDVTEGEQRRLDRLYALVVCKCPTENWSKSLASCPEGCALEQKSQIRRAVKAGKSNDEILKEQQAMYGSRVLARTPAEGASGFTVYVLPYIVLGIFVSIVLWLLARMTSSSTAAAALQGDVRDRRATVSPLSEDERRLGERVERELEEMD